MFFMQTFFAVVLGLASLGSIAFVVINGRVHGREPRLGYDETE